MCKVVSTNNMTKNYTILFSFLLLTIISFGQHRQDTVVNKDHYNFIDYYPNGHLKILGNYQDTIKHGQWVYFKLDGQKLAVGQYKIGHKIKVVYYPNDSVPIKYKWRKNNTPYEHFENDSIGNIVIIDRIFIRPCMWTFKNGHPIMIARML